MTHYRSSIALAIAAGLFAAAAQAGITVQAKDCTGCTIAQIEALVPSCEQGERFITDFAAGRLYEGCYDIAGVSPRSIPINGDAPRPMAQGTKVYHWIQPTAAYQNTFQAYLDVYNLNGHMRAASAAVRVQVDIRPKINLGADDGYMNAFDAVSATANNDVVVNWLNSTLITTQRVSALPGSAPFSPAYTAAITSLINSIKTAIVSVDFKVLITVVFHDGSTRQYTVDQYGDWTTVPKSARDAHGNPIPEKYDDVAGGGRQTYGFGGGGPDYDQRNFASTIRLWGIPVQGDSGATWGCVWSGSSNTLTCTRSK